MAGKVALVTGGARRVGRVVALALAQVGMDVAITYRRSAREARQVVAEIRALGRRAEMIAVDLARPDAAETLAARFTAKFNRLDALINNASVFGFAPLADVRAADFDRQMAVNARTPLLLIQGLAPLLGAHYRSADPSSAGRIVNFLDMHVLGQPQLEHIAYAASKAALRQITQAAAVALAPRVTVNALAPGVIAWAESYSGAAARRQYLQRVPLGRAGTPENAAAAVLFLVRDAPYCTGQIIALDGGRLLT